MQRFVHGVTKFAMCHQKDVDTKCLIEACIWRIADAVYDRNWKKKSWLNLVKKFCLIKTIEGDSSKCF